MLHRCCCAGERPQHGADNQASNTLPSPAPAPRHTASALAALPLMRTERACATATHLRLVVRLISRRDDTDAPMIRRLLDDVRRDLTATSSP